ncbi:MAG TPA: DUF2510 domain-containing protein, partial [Chloroflexaceae bacterium]|nr:DUF2510 domain-containing protein [Chloroflexaceae bacterium]
MSQGGATPGWYEDPFGRYEKRWFDGTTWTDQVWQAGAQHVDPPTAAPAEPAAPAFDPNATQTVNLGQQPLVPPAATPEPVPAQPAQPAPVQPAAASGGVGAVAGAPKTGTPLPPWLGALAAPVVAIVATVILSTLFDLFPRFILFTTKNGIDSTGKRAFVALVFGALLGAAVLGGPKLVAALGAGKLDQDALMPTVLGAAAGAVAGLVTQLIGFAIIDLVFFDPVFDNLGEFFGRFMFAFYFGLVWAFFGAVMGAVALAPIAGPDPAAKKRLPLLPAAGFLAGGIGAFLVAPGRFDAPGLGSAVFQVLLVAAAFGFASLLAGQGLDVAQLAAKAQDAAGGLTSGGINLPGSGPAAGTP